MNSWMVGIGWAALGALVVGAVAGTGCTGETDNSLPNGQGGQGVGAGGPGGAGGSLMQCDPACQAPQFCSVTGVCIDSGTCAANEDCAVPGTVCDPQTSQCVPGGDCGAEDFPISPLPPNLMLVMDRSGSMGDVVPNSGGQSRWQVAQAAVDSVLTAYDGKINFGLVLFSACTAGGCAPGTTIEPIGSATATISQDIANTQLCDSGDSETVIGGTLAALVGDASLQAPGRDNAVMLLTDGQDNCGGGGAEAAAALLAQAVPVKTYVVGFSGDVNVAELDAIAQAAGTAPYYQADDAAQLDAALQAIAGSVATCTYTLANPPDSQIYVFFNRDPAGLANDPNNGWTYDPATGTLTFHGAACDSLKAGTVTAIDVVFGCNQLPQA